MWPRTSWLRDSRAVAKIQVAYAIGVAHPVSVLVETFGTERDSRRRTDRRAGQGARSICGPPRLSTTLDLRRPIYKQTASYGHFGRPDLDLPWEKTDKADELRAAAGLKGSVEKELVRA